MPLEQKLLPLRRYIKWNVNLKRRIINHSCQMSGTGVSHSWLLAKCVWIPDHALFSIEVEEEMRQYDTHFYL